MPSDEEIERAADDRDEVNLLPAISRAAAANAEKDNLTVSALRMFRRSWRLVVAIALVTLAGLALVGYWVHDINARSAKNSTVILCLASSEQDVSRDLHTLVQSKAKAPASAYKIPPDCTLVP